MMSSNNFSIVEFDQLKASDETIEQYFDIGDEWNVEEDPDEPLFPREF